MQAIDPAEIVIALVREKDHVSFPEIANALAPYMPTEGGHALEIAPNVFVWFGMSPEFADLMMSPPIRAALVPVPANPLIYMIDGPFPRAPIAKRPTKKGYKTAHWGPIVFRLREEVTPKRRRASTRSKRTSL